MTLRRPKRATSQPVIGVTTAVARMLNVIAQAISSCVADIAPCICGNSVEAISSVVEYSVDPTTIEIMIMIRRGTRHRIVRLVVWHHPSLGPELGLEFGVRQNGMLGNHILDNQLWKAPVSSEDERHIGFLISDVARLMRTAFDRRVRALGLTRSQWLVINRLHRRPGATQSELAEMLEVEKATAGRMVDRMEKKGWVVRRADAGDRRVNRLHLTQEA